MGKKMIMDPIDIVEAVKILSPKIVIPIHWGTFSAVPLIFNMNGSPEKFEMLLADSRQNKSKVRTLKEGATLEI